MVTVNKTRGRDHSERGLVMNVNKTLAIYSAQWVGIILKEHGTKNTGWAHICTQL